MKTFSRLLIPALAICLGCSDAADKSPTNPRIADTSQPLIFITHPTEPPNSYLDENGECQGTDIELAKKIAARMGRELTIEATAFENLIPRLKAGTADFAIATITITEARKRDVDFSMPYEIGGNSFLYMADKPRPKMSQISSLRIAAESGTTGDLYLSIHGGDPIRFVRMNEAIAILESGKLDAIFFDDIPLQAWAEMSGGRFKVTPLETREGYGVAVNKSRPDILAVANEVIGEMLSDTRGEK